MVHVNAAVRGLTNSSARHHRLCSAQARTRDSSRRERGDVRQQLLRKSVARLGGLLEAKLRRGPCEGRVGGVTRP